MIDLNKMEKTWRGEYWGDTEQWIWQKDINDILELIMEVRIYREREKLGISKPGLLKLPDSIALILSTDNVTNSTFYELSRQFLQEKERKDESL